MPVPKMLRMRLSASSLVISGILFVLYPTIRPFSDETSLQGATAFASTDWLVAHILAIVAFTLLPLGLLGLHNSLQGTAVNSLAYWAVVMCLIGTGLTLPFYGGETFGLHAIGQEAIRQQASTLVSLATVVRSGAGLVMSLVGLLLLAIAAIILAIAIWRSGMYPKWSGVPFALGMGLYIPQFFGGQPLRITHGILVAVGCLWIAVGLWRQSNQNIGEKVQSTTFQSES
ncbi:hypothetical protein E2K98_30210 [Bacillus salipaludis]|uniref:DUF998 domain-containing protein n=1 Tax=Bacillus salipaludis TaxID=2547811 RepID=A0A4R5VH81_9BACI|nr:hypothetical protein [Bacillus salipaludis]MDQ6596458.1 hypothetical protein [Bacillus salipaludis]TDK53406.1 hypothetical protein E2K98_30210 [Bacillus salipaludis]